MLPPNLCAPRAKKILLVLGPLSRRAHKICGNITAVVAMKSPNNAEQSAAESVERRAGTKGNVGQQSTRRAQDRESVSQALERVRQAARQRKKEQFTSLLHHVDPAMLRTAFYALKRDAAPGVDGMTWETYERDPSVPMMMRQTPARSLPLSPVARRT
jgi:hypothetical protein